MMSEALTRAAGAMFHGRRPRIATGLLWQETNSFNPLPTTAADFIIHEGAAVVEAYGGSATSLGGILRRLAEMGAEAVPVLAAKARPGGPIEDAVILGLIDRLVEGIAATSPDGVCLELHGSMAGIGTDDVEGLLLGRLRTALGPSVPIVAALDLHGHVTEAMVRSADLLTGYRTHPHADMAETGERAAALLGAIMVAGLRPVASRVSLPFLAVWNDETGQPPMLRAHAVARALPAFSAPGFVDLSIFNTHPFLDLPGMGQVVLAYAEAEPELADSVTAAVSAALWAERAAFAGQAPEIGETLRMVVEVGRPGGMPVVIGDQGDSVLAGTPGDSLAIARHAAKAFPQLAGLAAFYDPAAVAAAREAGVGATLELPLGGAVTPGMEPWRVPVMVERLTDGRFANRGAYMTGVMNDQGPSAVLRHGALRLLATSRAPAACDPALAAEAGMEMTGLDFMVVKSSNHFRLSFAPECTCLVAASPGLSARAPSLLRHSRARPLFPIDPL